MLRFKLLVDKWFIDIESRLSNVTKTEYRVPIHPWHILRPCKCLDYWCTCFLPCICLYNCGWVFIIAPLALYFFCFFDVVDVLHVRF